MFCKTDPLFEFIKKMLRLRKQILELNWVRKISDSHNCVKTVSEMICFNLIQAAIEAGALHAGGEELIAEVAKGRIDLVSLSVSPFVCLFFCLFVFLLSLKLASKCVRFSVCLFVFLSLCLSFISQLAKGRIDLVSLSVCFSVSLSFFYLSTCQRKTRSRKFVFVFSVCLLVCLSVFYLWYSLMEKSIL